MRDHPVPLLVSRGYAVLPPNPRGSSGRGQELAAAVVGDMGGADTHDYLSGIDAMIERGIADPARIGTMGVSYGGVAAGWVGNPGPQVQSRAPRPTFAQELLGKLY